MVLKATIYIVLNRFNQDWATDKDLNQASNELNSEKDAFKWTNKRDVR